MKADDWNNSEARCSMSYNRKFYRDFDIKESHLAIQAEKPAIRVPK